MMKSHAIILIIIIESKLTTNRFHCFINGKIKKEPKKPRYKCSKNGQLRFSAASSKLHGKRRIPRRGIKICVSQNTAGPAYESLGLTWSNSERIGRINKS